MILSGTTLPRAGSGRDAPPIVRRAALTTTQRLILVAIFVVAGVARFAFIGQFSLWKDEIWSIEMSVGNGSLHDRLPAGGIETTPVSITSLDHAPPWWSIWSHMAGYTHPPLYQVALRWWMDALGNGPASARSLSAVFSLGALWIFFDICWFLHGPRAALFCAAIMALAVGQVEFAQETKMYSMLLFETLGCADLLVRIEKWGPSWNRLVWLALGSASIPMTHYLCGGELATLGLYAIARLRGAALRRTLAAFVGGVLLFLLAWGPWMWLQFHTFISLTQSFLVETFPNHVQFTFLRTLSLPGQFLFGEIGGKSMPPALLVLLYALVLPLPVILVLRGRRDLLLWVLWINCILGFTWAADLVRHTVMLTHLRFTIAASPAVYAILPTLNVPARSMFRHILGVSALVFSALIHLERLHYGVVPRADWKQLAALVSADVPPADLLVFYDDDPWTSRGLWYTCLQYYSPRFDRPWMMLAGPADAHVLEQLRSRRSLWLVSPQPQVDGPRILPGWVPMKLIATSACGVCQMERPDPGPMP